MGMRLVVERERAVFRMFHTKFMLVVLSVVS